MFKVIPMTEKHLDAAYEIEKESFSVPWSKESFCDDLTKNAHSMNFVAVDEHGTVAGYAMMWHVVNEGHINNIAVAERFRQMGVGSLLMEMLDETARKNEMIGLTLEVRVGNRAAMGLYHKYGFKVEGLRKNYYSDTKEDAAILWKYME
jgi:ribosomal-protein-alanine N-acetyltransferase